MRCGRGVRRLDRPPCACRPQRCAASGLDLVIEHRGKKVAIEIRFSVAPKPARGFWQPLKDLQISTAWVIAPVPRRYPLAPGVEVICLHELRGVMAALED